MGTRKEPDLTTYSGRLAKRIRDLRDGLNLSQTAVAKKMEDIQTNLKVPQKTFSNWENGSNSVPLDVVPALATALGVSPRELFPEF